MHICFVLQPLLEDQISRGAWKSCQEMVAMSAPQHCENPYCTPTALIRIRTRVSSASDDEHGQIEILNKARFRVALSAPMT